MPESYVSCPWLEGGLVFQNRYLSACCANHGEGKGSPFIVLFDGGEPPLETIYKKRDELRRMVNNGVDCACAGCPALSLREWPGEKTLFHHLAIANFSACNLDCYYCESHSPPKKGGELVRSAYDILPIIAWLNEKGLAAPGASVEWGGGEPTLVHEFEPLIRYVTGRGMPVDINTNAVKVSPAILDGLRSGRIRSVTCSVDAGRPETYAAIKKRDLFERVWRNLAIYAEAGGSAVIAKFILLDENSFDKEVKAFIAKCGVAGISRIKISRDTQGPLPEYAVEMAATMIHQAMREGIEVDMLPTIFGPADIIRMMYYVHQLIAENGAPVDFSRLFKLNHGVFEYLRFNSAISA